MLIRNSNNNNAFIRRLRLSVIITLIIVLSSESIIYAQKRSNETPSLRERIFFGGDIGLGFGTQQTYIDLSPVVGFWILPRLNVAIGPKYEFYKEYYYRSNIFGGRVYSQFVVIQDLNEVIPIGLNLGIFLDVEEEIYNLKQSYDDGTPASYSASYFIHTPLIGAGISQHLGQRASINLMVLWALYDKYDIYPNPVLRISFSF
jgi:hypothetical protein